MKSINTQYLIVTDFTSNGIEVYEGEEGVNTTSQDKALVFNTETECHMYMRTLKGHVERTKDGTPKSKYIVESVHVPVLICRA